MASCNKRIVILGGSSGIGLAVAHAAATKGMEVVLASSNGVRVQEAVATLPPSAEGRTLDLNDAAAIEAFFEAIGSFDHLVYTAGEALQLAAIAQADVAFARTFFELRYWGAYAAAKWAHSHIRPGGSITFTSGTAGARPGPGWSAAASICGAIEGLTRALALELAPIRVNAVAPGVVKSPLWREMTEEARETFYDDQARRLPVGHVGEPKEIAEGYLYLMCQTYTTGQILTIDGGGLLV